MPGLSFMRGLADFPTRGKTTLKWVRKGVLFGGLSGAIFGPLLGLFLVNVWTLFLTIFGPFLEPFLIIFGSVLGWSGLFVGSFFKTVYVLKVTWARKGPISFKTGYTS